MILFVYCSVVQHLYVYPNDDNMWRHAKWQHPRTRQMHVLVSLSGRKGMRTEYGIGHSVHIVYMICYIVYTI